MSILKSQTPICKFCHIRVRSTTLAEIIEVFMTRTTMLGPLFHGSKIVYVLNSASCLIPSVNQFLLFLTIICCSRTL